MTKDEAEKRTIIRAEVGSRANGLNLGEGGDRDEMAVCIEPIEEAIGMGAPFEQLVYRTAEEREGRHDAPSRDGDLDLTIYSLRKFVRLCLKGNPTVLALLFIPSGKLLTGDARGSQLQELAPHFAARQSGKAFLGYLIAQKQRLLGERGNGGHGKPRDELTEKFGYDTKFAMHMLRLGIQGIEFLLTGKITLPMPEPDQRFLLDVREGKIKLNTVLTAAGHYEAELKALIDGASPLPDVPHIDLIEQWTTKIYLRMWSAEQSIHDHIDDYTVFKRAQFEKETT